jgi:osmoprotectant transport system substrate-binding protein
VSARGDRTRGVGVRLGVAACVLFVAACTRGPSGADGSAVLTDDAITVGSFDFPESELLAEIYAQALTGAGFTVDRAFNLGPRELVLPAMQRGLIELVPEYQGSALEFFGGVPTADASTTQAALAAALAARGLHGLPAAPAQDQNAFVVTLETARRLRLRELSDLTTTGGSLRMGGPEECADRPLCLRGLEDVYGVRFASFVPLDAGGPLTVQALRQGYVDVGLLFTSSAALESGDLRELIDDRHLEPAEHIVPVIRPEVLQRFGGGVAAALAAVTAPLRTQDLRRMNAEVQDGRSIADVAASWVRAHPPTGSG